MSYNQIMKELKLSYFGSRQYIDVSTLTSELYRALPDITPNKEIANFQGRLLKKIMYHCGLMLFTGDSCQKEVDDNVVAIFEWDYEGKHFQAQFVESSELITERRIEDVEDPKEYIRYTDQRVILERAINHDCIYNLMKMGRIIVVKNYAKSPRVVKYSFNRLLTKDELAGVVMTSRPLGKKDFYCLETWKDGKKFGEIIVKALEL